MKKFLVVPYLSFPYTSLPAVAYSHENVRVCVCVCVCVSVRQSTFLVFFLSFSFFFSCLAFFFSFLFFPVFFRKDVTGEP